MSSSWTVKVVSEVTSIHERSYLITPQGVYIYKHAVPFRRLGYGKRLSNSHARNFVTWF